MELMKILPSLILYEDNHLIAYNKPAGVLVQGDDTGDLPLSDMLKDFLIEKYNKPGSAFVGMVHRLDRPTSGCIIFTKTSKAMVRMQKIFADRQIRKEYWALTRKASIPPYKILVNYIAKSQKGNRVECLDKNVADSKYAELAYEILASFEDAHLLRIDLKTGRKHQIRAQLSKIGCDIVGDLKYGYENANSDKSICLHCKLLSFVHPVRKEPMTIESDPPDIPEWSEVRKWNT